MPSLLSTLLLAIALSSSDGFITFSRIITPANNPIRIIKSSSTTASSSSLHAKKKNRQSSGQGFGKAEVKPQQPQRSTTAESTNNSDNNAQPYTGLSSIEKTTTTTPTSFTRPIVDIDSNLPTNERNKEILKQQFGLRTFEEKQTDIKAAEKLAEQKTRMQKIKQMKDEEFDIFMVIPAPIIKAIDFFLKAGLAVSTILFILAGIGITAEAWAVSTGNKLPEDVDAFIVNVIEPNFTPGLLVLLGFSISLGIFATAQLGSGSSSYKEN